MMMESQEEHDEYKRKQNFDYLTSALLKEKKKHTLAEIHFQAWGNIIFYISAFITLVQAVLATLAQSKASQSSQDIMNITIAILASFSVFWQSLIKHWNYGGRSSMHESAATALGKLYDIALFKARLEKVNMAKASLKGTTNTTTIRENTGGENASGSNNSGAADGGDNEEEKTSESLPLDHPETPGEDNSGSPSNAIDEGGSSDTQTKTPMSYSSLAKMFEQAIDSCTSQVPAHITAAFELLDNRVGVCKRKVHTPRKSGGENSDTKVEWERVYPTLYRQLTATIISQPFWPYKYPDPEVVVNETLAKYSKDLKETALLDDLLKRNIEIDKRYEAFEKSDQIA